jgi:hypothetical protein
MPLFLFCKDWQDVSLTATRFLWIFLFDLALLNKKTRQIPFFSSCGAIPTTSHVQFPEKGVATHWVLIKISHIKQITTGGKLYIYKKDTYLINTKNFCDASRTSSANRL